MNEQLQMEIRLSSIDKNIQSEQNYLHKFQEIKSGLMGDLLTGKKKVHIE